MPPDISFSVWAPYLPKVLYCIGYNLVQRKLDLYRTIANPEHVKNSSKKYVYFSADEIDLRIIGTERTRGLRIRMRHL